MGELIDLPKLVARVVEAGYPELRQSRIRIKWGRSSSFATISWTHEFEEVNIRCNIETRDWHESALTGLLSHELSHPAQQNEHQSERTTDLDSIKRGFGPYLGVARLFAGKYEDHVIQKGKDRYLGYRSIRQLLNDKELKHLNALLEELRLVPERKANLKTPYHDVIIIHSITDTMIQVDGHEFKVERQKEDVEVITIEREGTTIVLIDDKEVGSFKSPTN